MEHVWRHVGGRLALDGYIIGVTTGRVVHGDSMLCFCTMAWNGKELLLKSLVVRRLLNRHALSVDEEFVGLLIPQSVGGVVANMALSLDKRVAVNLNYTVSAAVLNACCEVAGIKTIIASRLAMKKFEFNASDLDGKLF